MIPCSIRDGAQKEAGWSDWRWQSANAVRSWEGARGDAGYPVRATPYYLSLAEEWNTADPIVRQVLPLPEESADDPGAIPDPIGERRGENRPCESVVHRYEGRALFIPTWSCAVNCRFCFRRERRGRITERDQEEGLAYIARTSAIREVIVTGGDPLSLDDETLGGLLDRIADIGHVKTMRLHTRFPVVNPFRLTDRLADRLSRVSKPLWLATQFNHPREITAESREAVGRLVDRGIPVLNQSVLLRGINNNIETLEELLFGLIAIRVKPYYLHHPDRVRRTSHLRIPLARGIALVRGLRGRIPGHAVPHYVLDIPGGFGKVPLEHADVVPAGESASGGSRHSITAPDGTVHIYEDDDFVEDGDFVDDGDFVEDGDCVEDGLR